MLKFSSLENKSSAQCMPNLLPCRIHHDGPANASERYWASETADDGKPQAYFRGRKLKGREVKVAKGYKGTLVQDLGQPQEDENAMSRSNPRNDDENNEPEEATKILQEVGSFDEIMVWGHESLADGDDPFVKGMDEWIRFAEAMHQPGKPDEK